jgi:hypothetical protein
MRCSPSIQRSPGFVTTGPEGSGRSASTPPNADDQLAAIFRQARALDPKGRRILNDMLRSLLKRDRDDAT